MDRPSAGDSCALHKESGSIGSLVWWNIWTVFPETHVFCREVKVVWMWWFISHFLVMLFMSVFLPVLFAQEDHRCQDFRSSVTVYRTRCLSREADCGLVVVDGLLWKHVPQSPSAGW